MMMKYRGIYLVRRDTLIVGFEHQQQAETYASKTGATWEPLRLYLAGHEPHVWRVYTGEQSVPLGSGGAYTRPSYHDYMTSDIEGTPHESEPCVLFVERLDGQVWGRTLGSDCQLVRRTLAEWAAKQ